LALLLTLALVSAAIADESAAALGRWHDFKIRFAKNYATEEHDARYEVFRANDRFIQSFPKNKGFTVAHNEYSDLTSQEFRARFNGLNITKAVRHTKSSRFSVLKKMRETRSDEQIPTNWDWRSKGAVTGVKNQGQCGSCWSFSATGSMEGAWFLKRGAIVSLSEQNLVDCSTAQGNEGCNGGLMDQAFQYVISNKGIDTEASYPYTATGPNQCQYNSGTIGATISSFTDVSSGSESALLSAVYSTPVSVAIDASQQSFQFYSGGVYNEPACSSSQLDHGVLAVGFGVYQGSTAYWLVKNSWGTSWGMNGYIMMTRNSNNQCGIATAASYPIV